MSVPRRIRIIGAGPGAPEYFMPLARSAAHESETLIGTERLLSLVPNHPHRVVAGPSVDASLDAIASCADRGDVAVLVSGDPGLFSLARLVVARFGRGACEVIPGISALQVAFARIALDWSGAKIVGAHASAPDFPADLLACESRLAIFLGCAGAASWLEALARSLGATHTFIACSDLTLADERVEQVQPQQVPALAASRRTILLALRKDIWP